MKVSKVDVKFHIQATFYFLLYRCQKGSLIQFELRPVYPTGDKFYCHVEPLLGQRLLVIEYEVVLDKRSESKFFEGELTLYTDKAWQKTGRIEGTYVTDFYFW